MPRFLGTNSISKNSITTSLFYCLSESNNYLHLLSDLYKPSDNLEKRYFSGTFSCKFLTYNSLQINDNYFGTVIQIYRETEISKSCSTKKKKCHIVHIFKIKDLKKINLQ